MNPTEKRIIAAAVESIPEGAIAIGQAVRATFDARIADEPILADMAKTIVANARVLARKLGFDPSSPAVLGAVVIGSLQHVLDKDKR